MDRGGLDVGYERHATPEVTERNYVVTWIIEVDGASARDAAWFAREIQLDPSNIATHYHVQDAETGEEFELDLAGHGEPCDECGDAELHGPTCSLHPANLVEPPEPQPRTVRRSTRSGGLVS